MSASQAPTPTAPGANPAPAGVEPSMEDILASIRRILTEEETAVAPAAPQSIDPPVQSSRDGVLILDPAMMLPDPESSPLEPVTEPAPVVDAAQAPAPNPASTGSLVAPEAAAAAASSVGSLLRTLAAERNVQVRATGPSIEDVIREELRPLLKAWLDNNLPPIVERLVRAEIERVVGRAVP